MKTLNCLIVVFLTATLAIAQVTSIHDIQYTTDSSGDSPLKDSTVTISGIVTGEPYAFGGSYYFVQDASDLWSGIKVYDPSREYDVAEGDSVSLKGTVAEYYGMTQIINVTEFTIIDSGVFGIEPLNVTTLDVGDDGTNAEAYEGVLIRVTNAAIANPDLGYGEWEINDGSGAVRVDDAADYYFDPSAYDSVRSITGIMDYSYSHRKIQPRLAYDVVESGPYTRFQRIQQVRYSDLIKAPYDNASDITYMDGDTVTVTGIVTMPTGLSFAGAGIKFIFGDPNGGPWSAILSYNPDSTAYPTLFEGDLIELSGYISEYSTGPSNMTEIWITSPIQILNFGQPLPPVDTVNTGDLRWPTTAEQWGNVIVAVKNVVVTDVNPTPYDLFAVDDGTGEVLVDDDSDSLEGYPDPPPGTIIESIRGWIYHHYGSYTDSTAYKLEPLYVSDIVIGAGPPQLTNVYRDPGIPSSSDAVNVNVDIQTNRTIDQALIYYAVNGGDYQTISLSQSTGNTWTGTIPPQSDGSWVDYFIKAVDSENMSSLIPPDTSIINYSYVVRDAGLTISDIQYTPWPLADSPFEGYNVKILGYVTSDTTMLNHYGAIAIQEEAGPWQGLFVFGTDQLVSIGDYVEVRGTVTDYNPDWHFKWDNNTVILADTLVIKQSGDLPFAPFIVTTGDLANDAADVESYEGTLVKVENVQIVSINKYDVSIDDGTGFCLLDDDAVGDEVLDIEPGEYVVINGDTAYVGQVISMVQGVFTYSFGTYKIEVRGPDDLGTIVGVADNSVLQVPQKFALHQNFPNPFNPETRISFDVPYTSHVKIVIYNVLGQQVRTLVNEIYPAGHHVVNWDGRSGSGRKISAGIYFYRMKTGDQFTTRKMLLLK
ncbi:MAG: T9SS type A sorting domain-containing protein [Fidelibacterota bacterium]